MLLDKFAPVLDPLLDALLPLVEDVFGNMLPALGDATQIVEHDLLTGGHSKHSRRREEGEER